MHCGTFQDIHRCLQDVVHTAYDGKKIEAQNMHCCSARPANIAALLRSPPMSYTRLLQAELHRLKVELAQTKADLQQLQSHSTYHLTAGPASTPQGSVTVSFRHIPWQV